jgi:hypothetical protein
MKSERIECTLEEASKKAREEGGRFFFRDCWYIVDKTGFIVLQVDQSIGLDMHVDFFSEKCIYETRSAFQEWESSEQSKIVNGLNDTALRKQGWNACLEAVLKMVRHDDNFIADYDIETLREP